MLREASWLLAVGAMVRGALCRGWGCGVWLVWRAGGGGRGARGLLVACAVLLVVGRVLQQTVAVGAVGIAATAQLQRIISLTGPSPMEIG